MRQIIKELGGVRGIYKQMRRSGYFKWYDDADANLGIVRSIRSIRPLMFVFITFSVALQYDPHQYRQFLMRDSSDLARFEHDHVFTGFEF